MSCHPDCGRISLPDSNETALQQSVSLFLYLSPTATSPNCVLMVSIRTMIRYYLTLRKPLHR